MQDAPERRYRFTDVLTAGFVSALLISQTIAQKIFTVGPLTLNGGALVFPLSYIIGAILTEVYGYARTRRVIWTGFFCAGVMSALYWVVTKIPPSPEWTNQDAFERTLGIVPRMTIASLTAYWIGEFANSFTLARMKVLTDGRLLWTRIIGAGFVGEAADTAVFTVLAFYGSVPLRTVVSMGVSIYVFKVAFEGLATPLMYSVVGRLKKLEGVDHFDVETRFNPFVLSEHK